MSQMSDYLENKLIDLLFRAQAFTAPTNIEYELYTAAPGETGGGTPVAGGVGYTRLARATALSAFNGTHGNTTGASSGTGGQTSNANQETFGTPTGSWGTVTHIGLKDTSGTNLLFYGPLTAQKTINNGDPAPYIAVGGLTVTLA